MREFTEQELVRRDKAAELRQKGIDPFGHRFDRNETALSIKEKYGNIENEKLLLQVEL